MVSFETGVFAENACGDERFSVPRPWDVEAGGHGLEPLAAILGRMLATQASSTSRKSVSVPAGFATLEAAQDWRQDPTVQEYRNLYREPICEAFA